MDCLQTQLLRRKAYEDFSLLYNQRIFFSISNNGITGLHMRIGNKFLSQALSILFNAAKDVRQ